MQRLLILAGSDGGAFEFGSRTAGSSRLHVDALCMRFTQRSRAVTIIKRFGRSERDGRTRPYSISMGKALRLCGGRAVDSACDRWWRRQAAREQHGRCRGRWWWWGGEHAGGMCWRDRSRCNCRLFLDRTTIRRQHRRFRLLHSNGAYYDNACGKYLCRLPIPQESLCPHRPSPCRNATILRCKPHRWSPRSLCMRRVSPEEERHDRSSNSCSRRHKRSRSKRRPSYRQRSRRHSRLHSLPPRWLLRLVRVRSRRRRPRPQVMITRDPLRASLRQRLRMSSRAGRRKRFEYA